VTGEHRDAVRVERGRKRVRVYLGGALVADTVGPLLVWERPLYPTYYFPAADVRADALVETGARAHSPSRGDARVCDVHGGGVVRARAATRLDASPVAELRDTVRFEWASMDLWLEEDEPVHVHARDPYKRIDVLQSSRRVRVEHDGLVLAESGRPRVLFETGLPPRWYLPMPDVRLDLLERSDTVTQCAYKGTASHWSLRTPAGDIVPDVAWTYWAALTDGTKIAGMVAFYDERLDVVVDGVLQERPVTPFS
jgi:uncharacterized protein (DUF427 family)